MKRKDLHFVGPMLKLHVRPSWSGLSTALNMLDVTIVC